MEGWSVNPFEINNVPTQTPGVIITGVGLTWRIPIGFDPTGYSSVIDFTRVGSTDQFSVTGVASDDYWVFDVASTLSTPAGQYRHEMFIVRDSDSERRVCDSGFTDVFATTDDRRTHAEIMVSKIESILAGRPDSDVESYSIKSRSITRMSFTELTKARDYYLSEAGRNPSTMTTGKPKTNTVRVGWV